MPRPQRTRSSENDRTRFFSFLSLFFSRSPFSFSFPHLNAIFPHRGAHASPLFVPRRNAAKKEGVSIECNRARYQIRLFDSSSRSIGYRSSDNQKLGEIREMELKMERKWKNGRGKIIKRRQVPYKFKKYETYLKKSEVENRWRNDRVYAQSNPCSRGAVPVIRY